MKINRVKTSKEKINNSLGLNIYYLGRFITYIFKISVGILVFAILVLLLANTLFKKEVEAIDEILSQKMFFDLVESQNYHNAIFFMENKPRLLNESRFSLQYKLSLSDCYRYVGQYGKAEKLLLDIYDDPFVNVKDWLEKDSIKEKAEVKALIKITKFNIAYTLADLYEKIGDANNVRHYFKEMGNNYDASAIAILDSLNRENRSISTWLRFGNASIQDIYEEMKIRIDYLDNPKMAMKQMEHYIPKVRDPQHKVLCYNKLIKWEFEQDKLFDAYKTINIATTFALSVPTTTPARYYGELADYCYMTHDMDKYRKIVNLYEAYLKGRYHKGDLEYLKNNVRKIRVLEYEGKWDKVEDMLRETCEGMKSTIQENFLTMGEEQREYFSGSLQMPFEYAKYILIKHPSSKMSKLVFDNSVFQKGLLLRSNLAVRQAVSHSDDKKVVALYDSLTNLRRELIARTSSYSILNVKRNIELRRSISSLDRQLSQASSEYLASTQEISYNSDAIQTGLTNNQAVVLLSEYDSSEDTLLYALVLKERGEVDYIPLCNKREIEEYTGGDLMKIYSSSAASELIWAQISKTLGGRNDIYYATDGFFNSLSIPTLFLSNGQYLYQERRMCLVSNPIEIATIIKERDKKMFTKDDNASIWGGINYSYRVSSSEEVQDSTLGRFITRGDSLYNLPGSWKEVNELSVLLTGHHIKNNLYTKDDATESTFKARSGKGDAILHISTHGFFMDNHDEGVNNPLKSSGLLFAGANAYWMNDSLYRQQKFLQTEDDGILRSDEIALLDFNGCELVVLSACQTGLGYSHSSEGVYGLQRAFKLAGAKKILMSMWSVSDYHTALLMDRLYSYILSGDNVEIALSKSKDDLRKQFHAPIYWGAFVLLN